MMQFPDNDRLWRCAGLILLFALTLFFLKPLFYAIEVASLTERTFHSMFAFFDPLSALQWLLTLVEYMAVGHVVALIWGDGRGPVVGFWFGAAVAATWLTSSSHLFSEQAPWHAYAWTYGIYALPPLGCCLGAWLGNRLWLGSDAAQPTDG